MDASQIPTKIVMDAGEMVEVALSGLGSGRVGHHCFTT